MKRKGDTMNCKLSIVLTTTLFCLGLLLTNPAWGGLILHLDASDPTTILDGAGVAANEGGFDPSDIATWNDKSGQGNNATQGSAADRPTWVPMSQNGESILRWTEPEHMVVGPVASSITGTNPGMTAFLVVKSTESDDDFYAWFSDSTNGGTFINDRSDISGGGGSAFGTRGVEARSTGDISDFHIVTAKYDFSTGVAAALYNGDGHTSCTPGSIPCTNLDKTLTFDQISKYHVGPPFIDADGDLAEIQFFDEHLSAAAENSIGYALEQKWGLNTAYTPEPSSCMLLGLGMLFGTWTRGRRFQPRR